MDRYNSSASHEDEHGEFTFWHFEDESGPSRISTIMSCEELQVPHCVDGYSKYELLAPSTCNFYVQGDWQTLCFIKYAGESGFDVYEYLEEKELKLEWQDLSKWYDPNGMFSIIFAITQTLPVLSILKVHEIAFEAIRQLTEGIGKSDTHHTDPPTPFGTIENLGIIPPSLQSKVALTLYQDR